MEKAAGTVYYKRQYMKYRINLYFSSNLSKVVDVENEDELITEKNEFFDEITLNDIRECVTTDIYDWDYLKED
jgi:hypothetical protein